MTADAPPLDRACTSSGVSDDEVLYVGKATNLRQRVRSYFGSDDRRKIGPMLREAQSVSHIELPDPLTAAVIEQRLISRASPATTVPAPAPIKYCYVKSRRRQHRGPASRWCANPSPKWPPPRTPPVALDGDPGHRGDPDRPSRSSLHGARWACRYVHVPDRCVGSLQRGPTRCGVVPLCRTGDDPATYAAVETLRRVLVGEVPVWSRLVAKMTRPRHAQRFEEAAQVTRDRLGARCSAPSRRHLLVEALRSAERRPDGAPRRHDVDRSTVVVCVDATRRRRTRPGRPLPIPTA
jgi:DNA polymerase III subunit epsilon